MILFNSYSFFYILFIEHLCISGLAALRLSKLLVLFHSVQTRLHVCMSAADTSVHQGLLLRMVFTSMPLLPLQMYALYGESCLDVTNILLDRFKM